VTISYDMKLFPGMSIRGKWNKTTYYIERKLGEGANGHVYLVSRGKGLKRDRYALKIGFSSSDLQSEINLLKKLEPQAGQRSFFLEADDFINGGDLFSFYVMQYIKGISLSAFIEQKGLDWLYLTGYYLLLQLSNIHMRGFAFCDVKPSNTVVSAFGHVELIDYGGASPFGKSVRQFTEIYDRGYWNCGSRTADSGYDLFAFTILFMQLADAALPGKEQVTLPQNRSRAELHQAIEDSKSCRPIAPVLHGMVDGKYVDSRKALEDWRRRMHTIGLIPLKEIHIPWLKGFAIASALLLAVSLFVTFH
jgi:serine/threonine protein kinase